MSLRGILNGRLLLVTGKGGTGKTTMSLALARISAGMGRKVVLLEVDNQRSSLSEYFARIPTYEPVEVEPGLSVANITWFDALVDWLSDIVPAQRLVRLILNNRMVRLFLEATPGSREVVILARIISLCARYDQVVVDMPASGHAVSFLRVPYTATPLFPTGPLRRTLEDVLALLARPDTHVLLASLPEDMVVNETVETWQRLRRESSSLSMPLVVLNQSRSPEMGRDESALLDSLARRVGAGDAPASDAVVGTVEAARWERERERATVEALARISNEADCRVVLVPAFDGQGSRLQKARLFQQVLAETMAGDP